MGSVKYSDSAVFDLLPRVAAEARSKMGSCVWAYTFTPDDLMRSRTRPSICFASCASAYVNLMATRNDALIGAAAREPKRPHADTPLEWGRLKDGTGIYAYDQFNKGRWTVFPIKFMEA
jgi:hypothetical protein